MTLTYGFELEIKNRIEAGEIEWIERGYDSSVPDGYEYRTVGGHELEKVKHLANVLFTRLGDRAVITNGCSFHIHVGGSFNGVRIRSRYEGALATFIRAELLRAFDRFPSSVKKRLASRIGKIFAHIAEAGVVGNYGPYPKPFTYEFRCFGNVNNIDDAVRCFNIAEDCTKAAMYQFKLFRSMGVM